MPLQIPAHYRTYRLMGIDPGLNFTGISIFDMCYDTGKILKVEAFTLVNSKLPDYTGFDEEAVEERTLKLYKLKGAVQWSLSMYGPSYTVCEAPFYNRLMPTAFGPLTEVVSIIHSAVLTWNPNIGFHTVPPLSVKKLIGTKAVKNDTIKGKEAVKLAVMAIPEIMSVLITPIESLSEHAIDAIAVCYTLINNKG